jgi:uncharacterized phage protein gp47/JayE
MSLKKFYKFSEIYGLFVSKFNQLTDRADDANVGGINRAIGQTVSFFTDFLQLQIKVAYDTFRLKTAVGSDLDSRVADWQVSRVPYSYSNGPIVFLRNEPATEDFVISADTVVSTMEDVYGLTIDYSLLNDTTFPSGMTSTTGIVFCTSIGRVGNVTANKIINIKLPIDGVDAVTNPEELSNGAEEETDDQLRRRVPLKINGDQTANEDSILNAAYSVPGVTFAKIKDNTPSNGEFTLYFTNFNGVVDAQLRADVKDAVNKVTPFCVVANYSIPTVVNVSVSLDLVLDLSYVTEASISGSITGQIRDLIYDQIEISQENVLRITDLIVSAKRVDGVKDISNILINGANTNKTVNDFEVIKVVDKNSITFGTVLVN